MGYYTDYTLTVERYVPNNNSTETYASLDPNTRKALEEELSRLNVFDQCDLSDGCLWCSAKWYEHDHDMLLLSRRFPGVLFTLHGSGEDEEDLWYTYYYNGRLQYAPVEFKYDDFDSKKLDDPVHLRQPFSSADRYSYE